MRALARSLAAAIALLAAGLASAADEEIVVTAERREKPLQETPASVVAFSSAALDASGIETTLDLPFRVPAMEVTYNSVLAQPYLRGVGSDLISVGADSSVATFVDGVYQARPVAAFQEFYDVERVEVLEGPQGTLFGRNATGGAVRVVPRRPEPELGAGADLRYGSFDALRARGFVNVPLVEDRLLGRLAGVVTQHDGFARNLFSGGRVDDADFWALRGQLEGRPMEGLSLRLFGDYARESSSRDLAPKLIEPFEDSLAYDAGGTVPPQARRMLFDVRPHADIDAWGTHLHARLDREAFSLTSLSAYRESHFDERLDLDATQLDYFSNFPFEDSRTFSEELQVSSPSGGALEWLGGVFYLHEDARQALDVQVPPFGIRDQPGAKLDTDAVGVFAHLSWQFAERWKASAGLRYSYEHKHERFRELLNGAVVAAFSPTRGWDAWTPRFVLEYTPRPDLLVYASASRGFKSGGFNSTVPQPEPFAPEFVWAFELGSRASPREWLRARAAFFYYLYDDIQLQVRPSLSLFPVIQNAGSAEIWGLEGGLGLGPWRGLRIDASLAFLDATFDSLTTFDPNHPAASPDQSGNRMPLAPQLSAWVGAEYRHGLLSLGELVLRAEVHAQSEIFFSIYQDPTVRQGAYALCNLRVGFDDSSGRFHGGLFVENLADQRYRQANLRLDGQLGNLAWWGPPRTYGFEVGARF